MLKNKKVLFKWIIYLLSCIIAAFLCSAIGRKNYDTITTIIMILPIILILQVLGIGCAFKKK